MAKKKVAKKGKDNSQDEKFASQITPPDTEPTAEEPEDIEEPNSNSVFDLLSDDEGGLMNMISRSVRKKDKRKALKNDFSENDNEKISNEGLDALAALGSDEEEDVFGQIVSKKKNKNKKSAFSFDSLAEIEVDLDISELEISTPKKDKKKKSKKDLPAFDSLAKIDVDLNISEPEISIPSKKNKNKMSKKDLPAFDALDDENVTEITEKIENIDLNSTKSKKSKKPKDIPAFDDPFDPEEVDEAVSQNKSPVSKKGRKNKNEDLDALAALIEDDSVPAPAPAPKPKKGKKKKDDDLDALAALIEDSSVAPTSTSASKNKSSKNKKKVDIGDLDAQVDPDVTPKEVDLVPDAEPEIKIKSAKQKEKERKERQKEEKRKQECEKKQKRMEFKQKHAFFEQVTLN